MFATAQMVSESRRVFSCSGGMMKLSYPISDLTLFFGFTQSVIRQSLELGLLSAYQPDYGEMQVARDELIVFCQMFGRRFGV
jgi:hypothetical protein